MKPGRFTRGTLEKTCWLLVLLTWAACWGADLNLPPREANAPGASVLLRAWDALDLAAREQEIKSQVLAGNVPSGFRTLRPIQVTEVIDGQTNTLRFLATATYLSVGSDADSFLCPVSPKSAQSVADALQCALPTRKMVDLIYQAADRRVPPQPIPPSSAMTTVSVFSNHNAIVRRQLANEEAGRGLLVAGHKKDVVITPRLATAEGKVAIYGWHRTNGEPIQPLYLGHAWSWVDYSQCTRLISRTVELNGNSRDLYQILADPKLCALLSDEGPILSPRYITNWPTAKAPAPGQVLWREVENFPERIGELSLVPDVQAWIDVPIEKSDGAGKKSLLIYYGLPNGNTIPQTFGKKMQPGDDWHFDIQHIGAQTRFIRRALPDWKIGVVYLANSLKSWPAWRKQHGDQDIPHLLAAAEAAVNWAKSDIVLSGHSGGGSLIFGYLNAVETIPNRVQRICFLDSNYAYDPERKHGEKLAAWLKAGEHYLCVLAYNDAVALLDGKPFVSAQGGTWGRSHVMLQDLGGMFPLTCRTNDGFEFATGLQNHIRFFLKENPERKIFHTVQVERNGFIHCLLIGTPAENQGYEYFGQRAYSDLIGTR